MFLIFCCLITGSDGFERSEFFCGVPAISYDEGFSVSQIVTLTHRSKEGRLGSLVQLNLVNSNSDNNGGSCGQSVDDRNIRDD